MKFMHPTYFGLNQLDKKLEKYLNYDNGFYIELGANDGVTQSNTLYYEKFRNWRGILIEPSPNRYQQCAETRSTRNEIFCRACVSFEYTLPYVEITYSNLMSVANGIELDLDPQEHLQSSLRHLPQGEGIFNYKIPAATLNSILIEGCAPYTIDLLSLDVEGAELEVLKGINFNQFQFNYMLIECRDLDRLQNYLSTVNYKCIDQLSHHDYLFTPI